MLILSGGLKLPDSEIDCKAVRAQGAGGQNVNKVSSAIHLRFDIMKSSLPEDLKKRLMALTDQRLTNEGIIVIKAQQFRTQEQNRREALERLRQIIEGCQRIRRRRVATRPTKGAVKRRLESKTRQGQKKNLRGRVTDM